MAKRTGNTTEKNGRTAEKRKKKTPVIKYKRNLHVPPLTAPKKGGKGGREELR